MIRFVRRWAGAPLAKRARRLARRFLNDAARADQIQRECLLALVRRNADSAFGRDHDFGSIRSEADYRRRVPIRDYDGMEPYLDRVRRGETGALFGPGTEILMFAMTSGTTARPKTIPVTREALRCYRDGWRIWGILAFDAHEGMLRDGMRPILQLASDWRESRTPSGIPCGAITGLTASMQHPLIRLNYCMPAEASRIQDVASKYYVALRLSVAREVGAVIAANPSTMLGIARLGDLEKETLIRDLHDGTIDPKWSIPDDVRRSMRLRVGLKRRNVARRLDEIARRTGRLLPTDYWWNLEFLANWTGGTMGAYLHLYPEYFGAIPIRDPGLIASEGRMTIPIEDQTPAGVLDYPHAYFEFIPEDAEDRIDPEVLGASELREGSRYFILLTTPGGLYRYQIRDLVHCVGFEGRAPVLVFLNKGSHFSSMTGEKLSEYHVVEAAQRAQDATGLRLDAFLLGPRWGDPPSYRLLVEEDDLRTPEQIDRFSDALERALRELNGEYENRRQTHRLGPVDVRRVVRGSWSDYRTRRLAATGGTLEQYKQPVLLADLTALDAFTYATT